MIVRLVDDSVWAPETGRYSGRLASGILWALQDLHIGITPRLAAQLAVVVGRLNGDSGRVWGTVFENLVAGMDLRSAPERFGLFAGANRLYSILKVAGPLVREACAAHGQTILLCRGAVDRPVSADEYRQYDRDLEEHLIQAADNIAHSGLGREHAYLLSTASRESPGNTAARTSLPRIDRAAAALMWGPAPSLPAPRWQPRQPPLHDFSPRNRRSPGPNQDAVEGIVQTIREADLGSIVPSEFLNPKELLADRLTQTGYFIYDRRPHREKLRDALVACVMPYQTRQLASSAFVKACWFDCMANLGVLLANYKLYQSEFRWIEADAFLRVRDCSFFLDRAASAGPGLVMSDRVRRWYLAALRWLPGYLDERAPFRPVSARDPNEPEQWAAAAWHGQKEHPRWSEEDGERGDGSATGISAPRFSFVHIMIVLPSSEHQPGGEAGLLGRLQGDLGLGSSPRRNVSLTYVPPLVAPGGWSFCARGAPLEDVHLPDRSVGGRRDLAGALERVWLDQLTREVWRE